LVGNLDFESGSDTNGLGNALSSATTDLDRPMRFYLLTASTIISRQVRFIVHAEALKLYTFVLSSRHAISQRCSKASVSNRPVTCNDRACMFKTALIFSVLVYASFAQNGPLTDEHIVNLAKGGLTESELINRIQTAPAVQFLLTPSWTDYMLKSGVSENVVKAMSAREVGEAMPARTPKASVHVQDAEREGPSVVTPVVMSAPVVPVTPVATQKPNGPTRIFVGETSEWQASSFNLAHSAGSYSGLSGSVAAGALAMSHAGLMKLTISVMNQVNQHCQGVLIVNRPDIADLFVRLDQSTSMWARHDDMVVFNRAGEMIFVTSTHSISKDAKRFCRTLALSQP
jgi:hypothetical protein